MLYFEYIIQFYNWIKVKNSKKYVKYVKYNEIDL